MKWGKLIAWIGVIAMTAGLTNGFINGDFFKDGSELLKNPWGVMSMVDLYVGFILFLMWVVFREKSILVIVVLTALTMVFGFLVTSIYILYNLYNSKGDWLKFFLGHRKEEVLANRV